MTFIIRILHVFKKVPREVMKALQFSALFFAITKSGTSKTIPSFSLPKEPIVVAGKVELESLGNQLQVKQFTQKAAIQWKEFNIGKDASLEFLQPNSQSSILNKVSNTDPSFILGKISSNGNVFVTNRNGIFFGKNATVDVGGLVASSLEIEMDDFINNEFLFKKSIKGGQIVNEGKLSSAPGGFVALLADDVRNSGIVLAEKGTVALASGGQIELKFAEENNLEGIKVDASDWDALVENKNVIEAEEGLIILSANAKSKLRGGIVNNSGRILAKGILRKGGRIILTAQENGEISNSGLVDASSKTAEGGVVTMEGRKILIDSSSITDVSGKKGGGMVLAGGDWQGGKNPGKGTFTPLLSNESSC